MAPRSRSGSLPAKSPRSRERIRLQDAASRPLRVFFVGAQATGKTELCSWTARRYKLPLHIETARTELVKFDERMSFDKMRVDVDLTTRYQRGVFNAQVAVERANRRGAFDRAFLDNLAYLAQHGEGLHRVMSLPACRAAARRLAAEVEHGDAVVFFIRPNEKLLKQKRTDGFRSEADLDLEGVYTIDGAVWFMLEMWEIKYVPIREYSFRERTRIVERALAPLVRP